MPPTTHRRKITQKELKAPDEFTTLIDSARDFLVNNLTQVMISAGIVVAVAASTVALVRARRKPRRPELGAVSDEWIAEHRAELPHQ